MAPRLAWYQASQTPAGGPNPAGVFYTPGPGQTTGRDSTDSARARDSRTRPRPQAMLRQPPTVDPVKQI